MLIFELMSLDYPYSGMKLFEVNGTILAGIGPQITVHMVDHYQPFVDLHKRLINPNPILRPTVNETRKMIADIKQELTSARIKKEKKIASPRGNNQPLSVDTDSVQLRPSFAVSRSKIIHKGKRESVKSASDSELNTDIIDTKLVENPGSSISSSLHDPEEEAELPLDLN